MTSTQPTADPAEEARRVEVDGREIWYSWLHRAGGSSAPVVLLHAARRPALVRSLVLVGVHTFVEELTLSSIAGLAEDCAGDRAPAWLTRLHGRRGPALVRAWAGAWLDPRRADWDLRDRIAEVESPILVVQGAEDQYGTRRQVDAVVERAPDARRWMVSGCRHSPHTERPDAFASRAGDFLDDAVMRRA